MNYIDRIFLRGDIQKIRGFLLHGVEEDCDARSYKERAEDAQNLAVIRLQEKFPDEQEYEEIAGLLYDCVSATEAVYLEIGLQLGSTLAAQVFQNLKTAWEER